MAQVNLFPCKDFIKARVNRIFPFQGSLLCWSPDRHNFFVIVLLFELKEKISICSLMQCEVGKSAISTADENWKLCLSTS